MQKKKFITEKYLIRKDYTEKNMIEMDLTKKGLIEKDYTKNYPAPKNHTEKAHTENVYTESDYSDKKKVIKNQIIQAVVIMLVFYAIEIAMVYLDIFPDYNTLLIADMVLRIIFGTVSIILIKSPRGPLFTNKLMPKIWLMMLPFLIYISLPLVKIIFADVYVPENIAPLTIVVIQQFTVGFYEEARDRGLLMDGLIKWNTATVKQRLFTVMISGLIFGLSHLPNIFFGENPLIQVPATALWGLFIAAIYMLSENLALVMLLHAFSDITPKISHGLFGWTTEPAVLKIIEFLGNAFDYVILPLAAVYICIRYDKLKGNRAE